jgi:hypothetical protein
MKKMVIVFENHDYNHLYLDEWLYFESKSRAISSKFATKKLQKRNLMLETDGKLICL